MKPFSAEMLKVLMAITVVVSLSTVALMGFIAYNVLNADAESEEDLPSEPEYSWAWTKLRFSISDSQFAPGIILHYYKHNRVTEDGYQKAWHIFGLNSVDMGIEKTWVSREGFYNVNVTITIEDRPVTKIWLRPSSTGNGVYVSVFQYGKDGDSIPDGGWQVLRPDPRGYWSYTITEKPDGEVSFDCVEFWHRDLIDNGQDDAPTFAICPNPWSPRWRL